MTLYYMANKNRHYVSGQRFEYRVRDLYRKHDWFVVKSAGSKGKADLVALKSGRQPHLIQCKSGAITSREHHEAVEMHALAESLGCVGVLASKDAKGHIVLEYTGHRYRGTVQFEVTDIE